MPKNSKSFKAGQSGNPKGRPPGVRSMARLIDSMGDETYPGSGDDYRTMAIRRLWVAVATGWLNLGETSRKLKSDQWIDLMQWMIKHMDRWR